MENSDYLWERIVKMTPSSYSVKRNRVEPIEGEDKKSTYRRMFAEMIDVMVTNVSDRFRDVSRLKFVCFLEAKCFAKYQRNFPIEGLNCLVEVYGRRFDPVRLKSELVALYCDAEVYKKSK
jgi:hypothetical protein